MPVTVRHRVDFSMIDIARIAYYPRLYGMAHLAFEELWMPVTGEDYTHWLYERKLGFPVRHIETEFHRPLHHGDTAVTELWVEAMGTTSLTFRYRMTNQDGRLIWTSRQVCVVVDIETLKPLAIPDDLREALATCGPPEELVEQA